MKYRDDGKQSVPCFYFENLEGSGLAAAAFTCRFYRNQGRLQDTFHLTKGTDALPEEIEKCTDLLAAQFHIRRSQMCYVTQKHTDRIYKITASDLPRSEKLQPLDMADGMITGLPGVMLTTFGADCPSVYLLDPVHKAIGLCHSGRKGTQQHIAAKMLRAMTREYGTDPKYVLAAVSPGICAECYEVGPEVAEEFLSEYMKKSGMVLPDHTAGLLHRQKFGRPYLNLNEAIRLSLVSCGVPADHIEISHLCTKCRSDLFYSFRAEGKISSENCALLMLNPM